MFLIFKIEHHDYICSLKTFFSSIENFRSLYWHLEQSPLVKTSRVLNRGINHVSGIQLQLLKLNV